MSSLVLYLNPQGIVETILAILVGAFLYGVVILLLKGFNKKEITFIKELLKP
jgi:hypothetical protein